MKILAALLLLGLGVFAVKSMLDTRRSHEIAQHHVEINWLENDVVSSLGEPASKYGNLRGGLSWMYSDGLTVEMTSQGRVYNLKREAVAPVKR